MLCLHFLCPGDECGLQARSTLIRGKSGLIWGGLDKIARVWLGKRRIGKIIFSHETLLQCKPKISIIEIGY